MDTPEELRDAKRSEFKRDDNISKLKSRMYSRERKGFLPWRRRRDSGTDTPLVKRDWEYSNKNKTKKPRISPGNSRKGIGALLLFSIAFFVLAGVGSFIYLQQESSVISADDIDIIIEGKTSISSGDVLEMQVLITNRKEVPLRLADVVISYPEGTLSPADYKTPLKAERIPIGKLEARKAHRGGSLRAVIFGNVGETKEIEVELQYRFQGSNIIHSKYARYSVMISSDAMSISVEANKELTPGQDIPIGISIKSNSTTILNGVYIDVDLPFGFSITGSSPEVSQSADNRDNNIMWYLGALRPGEERRVYFSGRLDGQIGDARILNISTGIGANESDNKEGQEYTILATSKHIIEVSKPFLAVTLESRGKSLESNIAKTEESMDLIVKWRNNLDVPINDAMIAIDLGGLALNKAGVFAGADGFYRSVDSQIVWSSNTSRGKLKTIAPGEKGEFKFKIVPISKSKLKNAREPTISFAIQARGKRLSEQGVPEVLREDSRIELKVATDSKFTSKALFRSSKLNPQGSLPPRAEYETVYGIVWEVSNTTNDISDAIVTAELPHYVKWIGLTTPANEQIIYNKVSNTLEWHLGTVKAGTGVGNTQTRMVSFAVGLVPSYAQIGSSPDLVQNQVFKAIDTFTREEIVDRLDNVDTRIIYDAGYRDEESRVIRAE